MSKPKYPPLQPLRIPLGWKLVRNSFYEIDPDATIEEISIFEPRVSEPTGDPWDDFLVYFFDSSYLWWAIRQDNLVSIAVEWEPMGNKNGDFWLSLCRCQPMKFPQQPKQRIKRNWCDTKLIYELDPPIIPADLDEDFERVFRSRDRLEIVKVLESWLLEESNHP